MVVCNASKAFALNKTGHLHLLTPKGTSQNLNSTDYGVYQLIDFITLSLCTINPQINFRRF